MVDWAQFNVKNEGKESKAFEEMIYLLFCEKYDKKEGILAILIKEELKKDLLK